MNRSTLLLTFVTGSLVASLVLAAPNSPSSPGPAAAGDARFAPEWAEVRRVLEASCLPCHGGNERESGLSFATARTFGAGGDRGPVVDAAAPASSRMLAAIGYENPELAMPPTGQLPAAELALLRAWIEAGASWPEGIDGRLADPEAFAHEPAAAPDDGADWWAYQGLEPPKVPTATAPAWNVHPIDAFIASKLETAGLEPAPRARAGVLLRRATYDLTGLPPTPDEFEAFLATTERAGFEAAWKEAIERLLASPRYGEHQARHWLDLVRYAETNGYERDGTKTNIWRYRDWVIRSLNDDKPYDRFLLEQLAGDELVAESLTGDEIDARTAEALLATGYYRLGVWDDEPADPLQARADELADIVDTTAQVFLGTTFGCARCHDHKADPITQRDYFALTAYFNNVKGYGGDAFGQHLGGGMTRELLDAPGPGVLDANEHRAVVDDLEARLAAAARRFGVATPGDLGQARTLVSDARGPAASPKGTRWRWTTSPAPDDWMRPAFDDSGWDEGQGGFGTDGTPGARVGTVWDEPEIRLRTRFALTEIPDTLVLSVHHDEDVAVFLNGVAIFERQGYRTDYTEIQLGDEERAQLVVGKNLLAVACRQTGGGQFIDVGLRTGLARTNSGDWLSELHRALAQDPDEESAAEVRALLAEHARSRNLPRTSPYPALLVSERGGEPPEQFVHLRGSAHAPGESVAPGVPEIFRKAAGRGARGPLVRPLDPTAPTTGRRLAFARWLVGEGSFLTARVMANRLWQSHFGRGLCRSPGDFGKLGLLPTHPELLDHLAIELILRKWSVKDMHRYIMTSRSYVMDSVGTEAGLARDPRNDLFWRFDPRRLTAEEYRDAVLATSGALVETRFGPSVYPEMDPAVLATASRPDQAWGHSSAADQNRRSIYVFVKRSLRLPLFEALDQPDPDISCPERFPTNVPTQALMTMNGSFVDAAAERLAERVRLEVEGGLASRVKRAIELVLSRRPTKAEITRGVTFIETLHDDYWLDEDEAVVVFCLGLYNRNEFLWVD